MEISNIGTDIVDIDRFRKKEYNENKKFYEKIFTKSEIKLMQIHSKIVQKTNPNR